ncbi:MAG: hypothetical protein NVS4B11_14610 [Ktedonobacteraceae bacterium]
MNKEDAEKYLRLLGQELQKQGITGEILVHDDINVLLGIKKPEIRRDIDAYLAGDETAIHIPDDIDAYFGGQSVVLREAIAQVAEHENIAKNWLDEAIKEILYADRADKGWREYPNLCIYLGSPSHLFAMQVATATSSQDIEVVQMLARKLHLLNMRDALPYVKEYIPNKLLTPEMRHTMKQAFKVLKANHQVQAK